MWLRAVLIRYSCSLLALVQLYVYPGRMECRTTTPRDDESVQRSRCWSSTIVTEPPNNIRSIYLCLSFFSSSSSTTSSYFGAVVFLLLFFFFLFRRRRVSESLFSRDDGYNESKWLSLVRRSFSKLPTTLGKGKDNNQLSQSYKKKKEGKKNRAQQLTKKIKNKHKPDVSLKS